MHLRVYSNDDTNTIHGRTCGDRGLICIKVLIAMQINVYINLNCIMQINHSPDCRSHLGIDALFDLIFIKMAEF